MPTKQDLLSAHEPLPAEDDASYGEKSNIKFWYFNDWLPSLSSPCAAVDGKLYHFATQTKLIGGKEVPFVTVDLEAFGITALKNFTPKWNHICPKKADEPAWKIPTSKQGDCAKYHESLWSSGSQGKSNKGLGGWHVDAYKDWYSNLTVIDNIRGKDSENKWKMYKEGLNLLRAKYEVTAKQPPQKKQKTGKKDSKLAPHKKEGAAPVRPKVSNFVFKEEEEDHYSMGSECSSGENRRGGAEVSVTATDDNGNAVAATLE